MGLLECNEDVVRLTLRYIGRADLYSVCLVHPGLRALGEPLLYSDITIGFHGPSPRPITLLLRSILRRPERAVYIRTLSCYDHFIPAQARDKEGKTLPIPMPETDLRSAVSFVEETCLSFRDQWIEELREGTPDAYLALFPVVNLDQLMPALAKVSETLTELRLAGDIGNCLPRNLEKLTLTDDLSWDDECDEVNGRAIVTWLANVRTSAPRLRELCLLFDDSDIEAFMPEILELVRQAGIVMGEDAPRALRLNASRSMVSLFDRRYQHIAEAIRPPEPATSVCENGDARNHTGSECGLSIGDIPVSVVNHLDADVRFCQIQDPTRQFYAGVPIRSPAGVNIGVYCVFDDAPRPGGLDQEQVRFIRDLSVVIMDYLAYKRSHDWYHREQRMVRGLGSFVEGDAALPVPEGAAEKESALSREPENPVGPPPTLKPTEEEAPLAVEMPHAETSAKGDQPELANGGSTVLPARPLKASSAKPPTGPTDEARGGTNIERVFYRAANLIRESLEVEGAVFLDAKIRSYGGLVGNMSPPPPSPSSTDVRHSSMESGSSDEIAQSLASPLPSTSPAVSRVLGFSTSRASSIAGDAVPAEVLPCRERFLHRLLQRYPKGRIFHFEADGALSDPSTSSSGDDSTFGSSTTTSTAGPASPTDEGGASSAVKPKTRLSAAERVIRMFPGARSVAVVPLWDPQTGRLFAGGFLWTRTPTRIFSRENELSYLRVFGLAIMAEVARQTLHAADKTKTDILGSISHELRTPLHGLVGTTEMLRNTDLDGFQKSVLWTLDASARTLLDTVDHLLDFIKANNLRRSSKSKRKAGAPSGQLTHPQPTVSPPLPMMEASGVVSLDLFVEEVLDSVLAGSSYLTMSRTHDLHPPRRPRPVSYPATIPPASATADQTPNGTVSSSRGQVLIYVDIDYSADWSFHVHPGALRRIVMNLFGNSLKFTQSGFIRVSLRQDRQTKQSTSAARLTNVTLTVSDSGRGIGEDYMRDHLFIPFSQEDEFAPGTGLGLNLVHRMVSAVGGTIDVVSKVGEGTTTTVVLPLPHAAGAGDSGARDDQQQQSQHQQQDVDFRRDVQALAGKRLLLRHFETGTRIRPGSFAAEDAKQSSQFQLMKRMCEDALRMTVLSDKEAEGSEPPPDFIVTLTTDSVTSLHKTGSEGLRDACPHVMICQDLASAHSIMSSNADVSWRGNEVLAQPVGPRKLARSLMSALSHWQAAHEDSGAGGPDPSINNPAVQAPRALTPEKDKVPSTTAELDLQQRDDNLREQVPEPVTAEPVSGVLVPPPEDTRSFSPSGQTRPPQKAATTPSQPTSNLSGAVGTTRQKSILIVDDNAINLKILAAYMTRLHYDYTTAQNGLEALQLYAREPSRYACVLTDISMPVMDGLELTRQIRELDRVSGRGRRPGRGRGTSVGTGTGTGTGTGMGTGTGTAVEKGAMGTGTTETGTGNGNGNGLVIIALTGLGGPLVEQDAIASGVDLFLTRPLMFTGLRDSMAAVGLVPPQQRS
ncbi:hypothetical protein NEMBOFW57_010605 [Staphylotrichum longicolle]|uniref:histidine kinase n=1 Tax=Staphylotrichum longicolle TaxID=669026 RepID=A0AAD4ENB6_9PEZI|nr:hypothetical protein NEMBOFW57_010605 [Staphylotrichum longicolle]